MVFHNRLAAALLLSTSSLLAACAVPSDSVITRASQVNEALSDVNNECQYSGISNSLSEQIRARADADDVLKRLSDVCPELEIGFTEGDGTTGSFRSAAIGGGFSDPEGPERSPTSGGTESSSGGVGSGSGSGETEGGASGTQNSGGGSSDGDGGDGSGGDDSDGGGSQGLGEAQGGIGGGGNDGSGGGDNGQTE